MCRLGGEGDGGAYIWLDLNTNIRTHTHIAQMQEVWLEHLPSLGLRQEGEWARCRALDMGAAPGGWTQYLR